MNAAGSGEGTAHAAERLEIEGVGGIAAVEQSRDALVAWLAGFPLDPHLANRVEVVLEELVSNVARHGAASFIRVAAERCAHEVTLTVEDDGPAFDPIDRPDPVLPRSLASTRVGGLGLPLIKRLSRRVRYSRSGGINRVEAVLGQGTAEA